MRRTTLATTPRRDGRLRWDEDWDPPGRGLLRGYAIENKSSEVAEMGDRLATVNTGRKMEAAVCPFLQNGSWVPSNTMSSGPSPTSVPSGILIHSTVRPQYTNITDRQDIHNADRQDNGPIAYGAPFYKPSLKNECSLEMASFGES